jgi:hypothetical protein
MNSTRWSTSSLLPFVFGQYLNQVFPNRWIERRGLIEWPARSPDLISLDFFLEVTCLKSKVFKTKHNNLDDLKESIRTEIRNITPETLNNVKEEFYFRSGVCQQLNREHCEH